MRVAEGQSGPVSSPGACGWACDRDRTRPLQTPVQRMRADDAGALRERAARGGPFCVALGRDAGSGRFSGGALAATQRGQPAETTETTEKQQRTGRQRHWRNRRRSNTDIHLADVLKITPLEKECF